ncbi:MAG: hypothetical protein ABW061_14175 [Polyangiaceae bacterium]
MPRGVWEGAIGLGAGFALLSCGARSGLFLAGEDAGSVAAAGSPSLPNACSAAPQCVTREVSDPCGPARLVAPECDATTLQWHCPDGAWLYQRAPEKATECLPLHDGSLKIESLSGSLSRIPTDDGRCVWIAEEMRLAAGNALHNVAFEPDPRSPFGACPSDVKFLGAGAPTTSVFFADGSAVDPARQYVQITGGFRSNGMTRVSYRLFLVDSGAVFGVAEQGTGFGYWETSTERIVVAKRPRFGTDLDYGNAFWVEGDYSYLWGCNAPGHYLTEGCLLGRSGTQSQLELYTGAGQWSASARPGDGAIVFDDGPWISSVERSKLAAGDLLHVFASGFSDHLQIQHANRPEGPWADATTLAACARPVSDAKSYCAGPVLHSELADPTRPGELVVSYGVATTGTSTGNQQDYWSRLTWLSQ